jgi:O-antigen ligase
VALACTPLLAGRRRRFGASVAALVAVATIALAIAALIPATATKRLNSSDRTGSGRTDIWRVGWRMVEDRPIVGVGAGNFEFTTIRYLVQPGTIEQDEFIVDTPKVAHNVYLQVLAELGIVGLTLMLVIIGVSMRAVLKAAANFSDAGDRTGEVLARALAIALVGLLAAYFFSSNVYSKQLWLMLALAPPLLAVSISSSRAAPDR